MYSIIHTVDLHHRQALCEKEGHISAKINFTILILLGPKNKVLFPLYVK